MKERLGVRNNSLYPNCRTKQYKGKVYPTGEYTLGYDSANYTVERRNSRNFDRVHSLQYHDLRDDDGEVCARLPLDVAQVYCPSEVSGQEERLTLGLATLRNLRKGNRRGLKGITGEGKRKVKASAWLLEKRYGRKKLSFATITIPPLREVHRIWLHQHWSKFVNRLIEEIKRELKRNGCPTHVVAVTEIQERRWIAHKEFYLHLHMVWVGIKDGRGNFGITADWLREKVESCVRNILREYQELLESGDDVGNICFAASVDLVCVRKSVAAYLGKYISKGCRLRNAAAGELVDDELPGQWWYTTYSLKRWLKACMQTMTHEECDAIMNEGDVRSHVCVWHIEITKVWNDRIYVLGACGRFSKEAGYHLSRTQVQRMEPLMHTE